MRQGKRQFEEMPLEKNDIVELTVEDISEAGEGIGHAEGFTLFIKDALPGDRVRAKVTKMRERYGYGRLLEILSPSPARVEAVCPAAAPCGGCQLQALSYEAQLSFKENKVRNLLVRIGGFSDPKVNPVLRAEEPFGYRNKAQFPVGRSKDGRIVAGFYAGRTHSIIETERCYVGSPVNERILRILIGWMEDFEIEPYDEESRTGLVRHVLIRTGEKAEQDETEKSAKEEKAREEVRQIMVCLVVNGREVPHRDELVKRLMRIPGMTTICLNINTDRTNVILGQQIRTLYGTGYITDRIGDLRYRISPQSFFQVNRAQTEKLYETALRFAGLSGQEKVWDLYCGTGTITLFLARHARWVRGVEVTPAAVEDARANAAANGINNASFYVGRAEEVLPALYREEGEKAAADVIVVDPPRKGCERTLIDTILTMAPARVVYVSCDPATLARDLKQLCEKEYSLREVQPVDMFPQTVSVETVCLLSKLKTKQHIEVDLEMSEMDLTAAEMKATYEEIRDYVKAQTGLLVSNLYIAQIKQKYGIIERENYNKPKSENPRVPKCPPEKEAAITEALKHFGMI